MNRLEYYARALLYAYVQGWDKTAPERGGRPRVLTSNEAWTSARPEVQAHWLAQARQMVEEVNKPKVVPIPSYGDHMTLERFTENCKCGGFTDYDGSGNYATATEMSDIEVSCSALAEGVEPALQDRKWTHIVWMPK